MTMITPDFSELARKLHSSGWVITDFRTGESFILPDIWEVRTLPGNATVSVLMGSRIVFVHDATTITVRPATAHENSYGLEVR